MFDLDGRDSEFLECRGVRLDRLDFGRPGVAVLVALVALVDRRSGGTSPEPPRSFVLHGPAPKALKEMYDPGG